MLCTHPYMIGSFRVPCGGRHRAVDGGYADCLPCLINRRRVWVHRMMLESLKHGDSCFVTLTYDESHFPVDGSLVPGDARDWLKRLRRKVYPSKLRYFLVGEYGAQTWRPHYHAAVFGLSPVVGGGFDGRCGVVKDTWPFGFTFVGSLTPDSAQYVAGYVTKKMTRRDADGLGSRYPEFARMSLRPGIGGTAVGDVARALETDIGLDSVAECGDVPGSLRHSGKLLPLGRYLRGKLRGALGIVEGSVKEGNARRAIEEMQRVYREDVAVAEASSVNVQKYRLDRLKQELLNCKSRFAIRDLKRGIL